MTSTPDNPLSYTGINRREQPRFQSFSRPPTVNDYQSFEVGDNWNDISIDPPDVYVLKSVKGNQATWQLIGSSSTTFPAGVLTGDGTSTVSGSTITDRAPVIGDTSNKIQSTAPMTDGQILIGSTGSDPVPASLTAGSNVVITEGSGSITIASTASGGITTVPTDGTPAAPADGSLTLSGGTGISTSGSGSTVTTSLDTPVSVSNGGTGASTLTEGGVLLGSGTAAVTPTAPMTDGQVLIGSTGSDPVPASLTAGSNIVITEGSGSITIASTASGGGGILVQRQQATKSTDQLSTGFIPADTTIPQNHEGDEYMSIAYTPLDAANILDVHFDSFMLNNNANTIATVALFKDGEESAVQAAAYGNATNVSGVNLRFSEVAASTSSREYKIRFGPNVGTMRLNGQVAGQYGGVAIARLTVYEYTP